MTAPLEPTGFDKVIGLSFDELGPDRVVGSFSVKPELLQPYGILHGGVYCSVIETTASVAGAHWFGDRGTVVGVNNNTNFLRATREGTLTVTAMPVTRGRTMQLWNVDITNTDGKLVATGQVRLANITDQAAIGG